MPKLAVKLDTDYRLSVMIHGEMGAQNVKMRAMSIPVEEMRAAISYPW